MRMRFTSTVVAGACVALLAAGCGSKDDKGLTKAEFLKQGNAICAKGNAVVAAAGNKLGSQKPSQATLIDFAKSTLIPNVEKQIDGVAALKPPKADKTTVDAIVTSARQGLAKVKANPILAVSSGSQDPFAASNKLTNAYGLKACGGSGG